jgi:DNA-binding XRE family transcriptional regulator
MWAERKVVVTSRTRFATVTLVVAFRTSSLTVRSSGLRQARLKRGLTQQRLAELTRVSRGQIIRLEARECDPRPATALVLAVALDTPEPELFPSLYGLEPRGDNRSSSGKAGDDGATEPRPS